MQDRSMQNTLDLQADATGVAEGESFNRIQPSLPRGYSRELPNISHRDNIFPIPTDTRKRRTGSTDGGMVSDAQQKKQRSKVSRACDACKTKKTRCSGEQPCVRCQQIGLPCRYLALYTRGRLPPVCLPLDPSQTENQPTLPWIPSGSISVANQVSPNSPPSSLDCDEDAIGVTNPSSRGSPVPSADIGGEYHGPSSPITFLERAWKRFKQNHISSAPSTAEDEAADERLIKAPGDAFPQLSDGIVNIIPTEQHATQLVTKYFDISNYLFIFLHRNRVSEWVEALYQQPRNSKTARKFLSCSKTTVLLMIFATTTSDLTEEGCHDSNQVNGVQSSTNMFLAVAQQRLQRETGAPNLESVQARLIECLYLLSTSQANEAYVKFGTAVSMIITLGLHRRKRSSRYKVENGPIDQECQKRTFWAAYTIDRYLSVMGGRPRILQDFDIDQELPKRIDDEDLTAAGIIPRSEPFDTLMDAPIMHSKLARIIGQTSGEIYPLQRLSQEESLSKTQRSADDLALWKAQLPPFLRLVPPSSLIPVFQRQSIVLRLAHAHAVIHANRPFLLSNFTKQRSHIATGHERCKQYIHDCVNAARQVVNILNSFDGTGIPFYSSWFTQYVSFCAVAVLYLYKIQEQQIPVFTPPSTTSAIGPTSNTRDSYNSEDYFTLAEHCQRLLATAAKESSPGKRYNTILEELRQEVHRYMRTSDSDSNQDISSVTNEYENIQHGLFNHDEVGFIADMEMDMIHVFGDWIVPE
ncbi:fungal-specific transcription factor domain-containing protein [Xylogone sp. PMI_703]|nr:fungal-specific transcription factor domain-containing protein [Xylogone sp. PMI_703]